ncbi:MULTISPECIES: InlB B-repeat-containing protein [Clostridium]|uniref:InlB B-repeat-containing protein n=2 Tax=Clostridium beijerinckii TaxID=1520 RepID=A0AAE2UV57_CLOBE|nr:InlB B-repeat-containing protein [Clostridium beijerinckii]ABR36829.1 cell wall/surface repeat protein [Clostridium beijerinckii NCIMB 8052]AIU04180.1 cell wall/surface repeat-containing protein [Clostridium beijerinckii ATCC 35702]MBF7808524.1 InlB B-repeat-containing protein [Clostridium beijerinckii]NRT22096.1 putative repeat protein (TIGR02543 family) [Clostridium beijerinckii]NRT65394.1 putative repeat protein (TIGR02543 family) [Clostridium beijerinckii]
MKYEYLRKSIAVSLAISSLITVAPVKSLAAWIENYDGSWSYADIYGYANGGWKQINGIWYYFDSYGLMRTGWILDNGEWYYTDLSGVMQTGVIQIEGKIYIFSENGAMQKGTSIINGRIYNLDDSGACIGSDYPIPTKSFDYYGNNTLPYVPNQIIDEDSKMSKDIPTDPSKEVKKQYKVKFKDPEAEDDDDELLRTKTVDEDTMLTLYKPVKNGYTFIEWNTKSDGDGSSYEYDDRIKITKDITLYAQWRKNEDTGGETTIKVENIVVLGPISGTTEISSITTKGGSLQMSKKVYPTNSDNQKVKWLVVNEDGSATISDTGKLTAISNGKVIVKAIATDGSGVIGTKEIKISGQ